MRRRRPARTGTAASAAAERRPVGGLGLPVGAGRLARLSVLPAGSFPGVDETDVYESLDRHEQG